MGYQNGTIKNCLHLCSELYFESISCHHIRNLIDKQLYCTKNSRKIKVNEYDCSHLLMLRVISFCHIAWDCHGLLFVSRDYVFFFLFLFSSSSWCSFACSISARQAPLTGSYRSRLEIHSSCLFKCEKVFCNLANNVRHNYWLGLLVAFWDIKHLPFDWLLC